MNEKQRIYELVDSFLVEAKDQNGKERSVERLNQDRHLFVKGIEKILKEQREDIIKEFLNGKRCIKCGKLAEVDGTNHCFKCFKLNNK